MEREREDQMESFVGDRMNRSRVLRDERGITGLETAIVLIAFVVVASVFAFSVLSTGLLSTEKSKEAVLGGLSETQATLVLRGAVVTNNATTTQLVNNVVFQVSTPTAGDGVDLSDLSIIVTYIDEDQSSNIAMADATRTWLLGTRDILNSDERVEFQVDLTGLTTPGRQQGPGQACSGSDAHCIQEDAFSRANFGDEPEHTARPGLTAIMRSP